MRLTQGDYNQIKVYDEDPVAVAKRFAEAGIERLHMVDLDGAKAGKVINHKILKMLPLNLCLIKIEFSDKLLPLINAIQGYIPQFKTIEYHLKILD